MGVKINIQQDLWEAIEKNYENESYSSAILDAIHFLTETIRDKTGLEGDGSSLIGQAFGGTNPMIRLNKLQTESEKNVQKGMQELLRGFYIAIRNPRSHEKHVDTKADADAIIIFIDYLFKLIASSKVHFEEASFLGRVFDLHYVQTKEYSDLLCSEIPKGQRLNIAIKVILNRKEGNIYNLSSFMHSLLEEFEESELHQVYSVISDELKYTSLDEDIRTILHIMPPKFWNMINKVVRMRIEHILFKNVESGNYDSESKKCIEGALGTWIAVEHFDCFENIFNWTRMIVDKLRSNKVHERNYAEMYFWHKICHANKKAISYPLKSYLKSGLLNKDSAIVEKLEHQIQFDEDHPWWKEFDEQLKEYPHIQYVDIPWM